MKRHSPAIPERDQFSLGSVREDHRPQAQVWQSMLVCERQVVEKPPSLRLLTTTARVHGWMLYLADPDGNTYPSMDQFAECR
jgi:hypothetical protein